MKFFVCGDIHGDPAQLSGGQYYFSEKVGMIALGDFGANFTLDKYDNYFKQKANSMNIEWYVVKGNHEARPSEVPGIKHIYDDTVQGYVYVEDNFPHIHYFDDYGIYNINGFKCAVIGGAYSIDKSYRIQHNWPWFSNEQLSDQERADCMKMMHGKKFDFIFSHTTAYHYRPSELFSTYVDQYLVDNSMELFLQELMNNCEWNCHCFGHYHGDMHIAPKITLLYTEVLNIQDIYEYWDAYKDNDIDGNNPVSLFPKAKNFYTRSIM